MKPVAVYLNSRWRPGCGMIRSDGSLQGGRYRVSSIEEQGNGRFDVSFLKGEVHFTYDENNPPPDQKLVTASGRPLTVRAARDLVTQGYYMTVGGYAFDGTREVDLTA